MLSFCVLVVLSEVVAASVFSVVQQSCFVYNINGTKLEIICILVLAETSFY